MAWRMAILLIWLWAAAGPAAAGAWLREKGRLFNAASATFRNTAIKGLDQSGFYIEYGAGNRLTLGVDFNQNPGLAGHALIFARVPILPQTGRDRLAAELGVGAHNVLGFWWPMYKLTLSYGREISLWRQPGWVSVDWAVEYRTGFGWPLYKLDATVGQSSGGRFRPIVQLETAYVPGFRPSWAVTSGVMFDGWAENQTWVVGIESRQAGIHSLGLKLAVWHQF